MSVDDEGGLTLVELLLTTAIVLAVTGAVFQLLDPARAIFQVQPELADLQQRLRVGVGALVHDLTMAGAGPEVGPQAGPLSGAFATVLPYRAGAVGHDPAAGVFFREDAITVIHVPSAAAQAALREPVATPAVLELDTAANCVPPSVEVVCGFAEGTRALLYDSSGAWDAVTIAGVAGQAVMITSGERLTALYAREAKLVEVVTSTYYLKPGTETAQLMRYDGNHADVPVVDHVVGLRFDYYDDRQTTPLSPVELADGPWRPHPLARNRFDVDLLAIRRIGVTMRVQVGAMSLRGRGALFRYPGRADGFGRYIPDHDIRFDVAPRNLNPGRS